ncbi:hypothetical protein F2P79_024705 [Pimephales promelas]|nr:hypothetical protein F2P79_024705 [Pimephales promelas]
MRICAIGRLNLRKTSRRDDIDEGLQLVFGNGCGSKTRFAQRFINKFKAKSGDTILAPNLRFCSRFKMTNLISMRNEQRSSSWPTTTFRGGPQ